MDTVLFAQLVARVPPFLYNPAPPAVGLSRLRVSCTPIIGSLPKSALCTHANVLLEIASKSVEYLCGARFMCASNLFEYALVKFSFGVRLAFHVFT